MMIIYSIYYLAGKACLLYPNGLSEIYHDEENKKKLHRENINYTLIVNTPKNFKEYLQNSLNRNVQNMLKNSINNNNETSYLNVDSNLQLVSSGRTGFFLNRCIKNDSMNNHIENVINSQKKIDLKKLVNDRLEMLKVESPEQTKYDELRDCVFNYLKKKKWESKFNSKLKTFFEFLDEDTRIFNEYVINLHLLEMRRELLNFWENNIKMKDFSKKFEEIFDILELKYTLLIIIRIYHFISGVSIILEQINDEKFKLSLFTDEINYGKIAKTIDYPLQLKPYALKYMMLEEKCKLNDEELKNALENYYYNENYNNHNQSSYFETNKFDEKSLLVKSDIELRALNKKNIDDHHINEKKIASLGLREKQNIIKQKIDEMNTEYKKINFLENEYNDHLLFSPYRPCYLYKYEKFRTYNKVDIFEENQIDEDFSSQFICKRNNKKSHIKEENLKSSSIVQHTGIVRLFMDNKEKSTEENVMIEKIKNFFCDVTEPETSENLSIFRSIDKLRLLSSSFDKIFIINRLKTEMILDDILYNRNIEYKIYEDKKSDLFYDSINFISRGPKTKFLNHFRNQFGEELSFYFLWLRELIMYLLFPAFFGIIFHILLHLKVRNEKGEKVKFSENINLFSYFNINIRFLDLLRFIIFSLTSLWCYVFIQNWKSKEMFYSYIWGCSHSVQLEPYQESYIYDEEKIFIFDWKIKTRKKLMNRLKRLASFLISFFLVVIVIIVNVKINSMRDLYLNENPESKIWKILPGVFNVVFIKSMSFIYRSLANYLSYWENHEKNSRRIGNMSFKIFIFEFVNNFFIYYYIAIYKFNKNFCTKGGCIIEVESLSYSSLFVLFCVNSIEIGIPFFKYYRKLRNLKYTNASDTDNINKSHKNENDIINSDEFKIELSSFDDLTEDYLEIIIYFGYIMLISSIAPLTPLFILLLLLSERAVDAFKFYFLVRYNSINSTNGIGKYNYMIKILLVGGIVSNLMMITFSRKYSYVNPDSVDERKFSFEFLLKVLIFLLFENLIFLVGKFIKFKNYPECKFYLSKFLIFNKIKIIKNFENKLNYN